MPKQTADEADQREGARLLLSDAVSRVQGVSGD